MRILLAYAGKHGTTQGCVERLKNELSGGNEVVCANLEREDPDPSAFDLIVFGSSVYFGKLRPAARCFLQNHTEELLKKPLGLFLVCGLTNEYEYYREKLFSRELREHAFLTVYFGGSLSVDGLSFGEKWIVKSMRAAIFEESMDDGEYTLTLPGVLPENIDRMATYLLEEINRLSNLKT